MDKDRLDLVKAYLSRNEVPLQDIPRVWEAFGLPVPSQIADTAKPSPLVEPAIPVKDSVTHDAVICLECRKPFKSLRRHLSAHKLDEIGYRGKYGLPHDYPLIAPAYREERSQLAKKLGLGRKPKEAEGKATSTGLTAKAPKAA